MTAPPTLNAKARREVSVELWLALTIAGFLLPTVIIAARLFEFHRDTTTRLEAIAASLAVIEANTDRGREP